MVGLEEREDANPDFGRTAAQARRLPYIIPPLSHGADPKLWFVPRCDSLSTDFFPCNSNTMKGLSLLAAASAATAHTIFVQLESGGTTYPVSHAIRDPSYDGPITDVTSNSLACNGSPNPTTPSSDIITVTAGTTVKAIWRHTLTSGADDVMDASHKGPTLAYLKKVRKRAFFFRSCDGCAN